MKKILILISYRKLYRILVFFILFVSLAGTFAAFKIYYHKQIQVIDLIEEDEITELEKENSRLKETLKHIVPGNAETIYEDKYRNIYANLDNYTPPSFKTYPLQEVLKKGTDIKFNILSDQPSMLRPLYDPSWKGAFFRGWLYLPQKNIEARHKLFIFPFGGSSIYDFTGSLGFKSGTGVDYHRNINFLVYGLNVKSVKKFENQTVLTGEPLRTGVQIVSVVQDDLLPNDINTKDFLFHLSTPEGYEIDFIYGNVIKYEYLKKKIEENTVKSMTTNVNGDNTLEQLINENFSLKKELSYFVPLEDKVITQEKCKPIPPNFPYDAPDIHTVLAKSKKMSFNINYQDNQYRRLVYDPLWLRNYKKRWCFIPKQVCYNQHKLFLIPDNPEDQFNFFGILGFHENYKPVKTDEYGFLIYNFSVNNAFIYNDQILLIGEPARTGAQIISINCNSIQNYKYHLVRIVTPDNQEVDWLTMQSKQ